MTFLTESEKRNVARWHYNVSDKSITTRLFTPLWEFWVKLVPDSVAPNVLTAAALLCQIQAFYICFLYGSMFPRAVSLAAMCLIVVYQTLDAIDGKHARNIRNSSPLGELFDYGCDNLGSVFMVLALCFCLGIQNIPLLWYIVQITQLLFLQSHVKAFQTGKVVFGLLSGPGEILFVLEMIFFVQFALPSPVLGIVHTYGYKAMTAVVSVLPVANRREWVDQLTDPLNICRTLYAAALVYSVMQALSLGKKHYATRTGLILCYLFRAFPLVLVHISPLGSEYTLRDVVLDGLFMSVITSDVIVSKMAAREIHPFVVLFAMISLINPLLILAIVCFYYVALFLEISEYMNIPIFSVSRNVYVDGVYDLCHYGHKKQFENALAMGNRLIVGVVSDENVWKYKQKYPVMNTKERVTEVQALRMVSEVIENCPCPAPFEWRQSEGLPPTAPIVDEEFIRKYRIHIVAHGEEYLPEKLPKGAMDYYKIPRAMGICRTLPRTPGISTSELMQRMKDRVTEKDRIGAAKEGETKKGESETKSEKKKGESETTKSVAEAQVEQTEKPQGEKPKHPDDATSKPGPRTKDAASKVEPENAETTETPAKDTYQPQESAEPTESGESDEPKESGAESSQKQRNKKTPRAD